jgi:hypothetical protein
MSQYVTSCCGGSFIDETDFCGGCHEHSSPVCESCDSEMQLDSDVCPICDGQFGVEA